MTELAQDKEMDGLKAEIVRLREKITVLSAGMNEGPPPAAARQEDSAPGGEGHGAWGDLLHKLNASKVQGEKVVRDLAAEVEHHPLISIVAAFGMGYIIAKLWYRGKDNGDTREAL
jgi:hypothetical protein